MSKRITTEGFIQKAKEIHKDTYDYSKTIYINSKTKICIQCPDHGEFWQNPYSHKAGIGCPACGIKKSANAKRSNKEEFIKAATKKHRDFYSYSKVVYKNALSQVTITCPTHGDFCQKVSVHLKGHGCPKCAAKNISILNSKSPKQFIQEVEEVHKGYYSYEKTNYVAAKKTITITCPVHGDFSQVATVHLRGSGCNKCGSEYAGLKMRESASTQFFPEAARVHSNKYDYSKVKYIDHRIPVNILCPIHGEFSQSPGHHLDGRGCPTCGHITVSNKKVQLARDKFIPNAKNAHGEKYKYDSVCYVNSEKPISIFCPVHGLFQQTPVVHLKGHGCPRCSINLSKREDDIGKFLGSYFEIELGNRKLLKGKELDVYIPSKKFAIEYNGSYWHSEKRHPDPKWHMKKKQDDCKKMGIRLIHASDYENQTVIKKTLAHILGINQEKYYARKCTIDILPSSNPNVKKFLDSNHLQGSIKGCLAYCLRMNGSLVAVMLFSKTSSERGNTDYTRWELRRFSSNCRVVGGASKLLKAFTRGNKECRTLLSYSDNRWFTGKMYKNLGFELVKNLPPDYKYMRNNIVKPKSHFKRSMLTSRKDIDFRPEESEKKNCERNGWYRIWDCGKKKWELKLQSPS